ncbi:MAG: hypothetical protein ACT4QC_00585 [Planctomycetaceae bacterium]
MSHGESLTSATLEDTESFAGVRRQIVATATREGLDYDAARWSLGVQNTDAVGSMFRDDQQALAAVESLTSDSGAARAKLMALVYTLIGQGMELRQSVAAAMRRWARFNIRRQQAAPLSVSPMDLPNGQVPRVAVGGTGAAARSAVRLSLSRARRGV